MSTWKCASGELSDNQETVRRGSRMCGACMPFTQKSGTAHDCQPGPSRGGLAGSSRWAVSFGEIPHADAQAGSWTDGGLLAESPNSGEAELCWGRLETRSVTHRRDMFANLRAGARARLDGEQMNY